MIKWISKNKIRFVGICLFSYAILSFIPVAYSYGWWGIATIDLRPMVLITDLFAVAAGIVMTWCGDAG